MENPEAILAGFGVAQSVLFAGTYAGAKVFPNLQKFFPVKWAVDKVEKWINIAQINNPNASKLNNVLTGVLSKSLWLIGSCAVTGFLFDLYNNIMDTKLNGKFSNVKQGVQKDSWLISGLKSLSGTDEGKKIIRNSMKVKDMYLRATPSKTVVSLTMMLLLSKHSTSTLVIKL